MDLTFSDGSTFSFPTNWDEALDEKWREQHSDKTKDEFVGYIIENVEDQFRHKTVTTKFGLEPWDRENEYGTMAELAADSVYAFLRFYLLRIVGREIGIRVISPEEVVEELTLKELGIEPKKEMGKEKDKGGEIDGTEIVRDRDPAP